MKKAMAWGVLVLLVGISAGACSDNPKASEACKGQSGTEACDKCCHDNGAHGYKYMGSACSCLN